MDIQSQIISSVIFNTHTFIVELNNAFGMMVKGCMINSPGVFFLTILRFSKFVSLVHLY